LEAFFRLGLDDDELSNAVTMDPLYGLSGFNSVLGCCKCKVAELLWNSLKKLKPLVFLLDFDDGCFSWLLTLKLVGESQFDSPE